MNKFFYYDEDSDQQIAASTAGDTWSIAQWADIIVDGTAIDATVPALDRTFIINGLVHGLDGDGLTIGAPGQEPASADNVVVVGKHGDLFGSDFGLEFYADRFTLNNRGTVAGNVGAGGLGDGTFIGNRGVITGVQIGVFIDGADTVVVNERRGFIQGENGWGVELKGEGATLLNKGEVYHAAGTHAAVFLNSLTGQTQALINTGVLVGDTAIYANFGDDVITNNGTIEGNVRLGDGDDVFVNEGGWVNGTISGGVGDDTYLIDRTALILREEAGEGTDYVHATVSFTLGANFDWLILDGDGWINGTGNNDANTIYGNAGRNRLMGLGGDDYLAGLGGRDQLTGGTGDDTFAFGGGSGVDQIMDFANDEDRIEIDLDGIDDFADVESIMSQSGANVVINAGNGDRLVIRDTTLAELDATDFLFV